MRDTDWGQQLKEETSGFTCASGSGALNERTSYQERGFSRLESDSKYEYPEDVESRELNDRMGGTLSYQI